MENGKVCSFFGHREINLTDELYTTTETEILKAVKFGCNVFYFGGYGEFDSLCYEIVTKIKKEQQNLNIQRVYCVPLESYLYKKVRYFNKSDYDNVIYLETDYKGWYKSIYFRNLEMINNSNVIIFYAQNKEYSGAYKAYQYALSTKNKTIINIYHKVKA